MTVWANGADSTGTDTPSSPPLQPCQKTSSHRNIPTVFTTNNCHTLTPPYGSPPHYCILLPNRPPELPIGSIPSVFELTRHIESDLVPIPLTFVQSFHSDVQDSSVVSDEAYDDLFVRQTVEFNSFTRELQDHKRGSLPQSRFNRPLMSAFCLQNATFPWVNSRDAISPLIMQHVPAFLHIQHQSTHSQFQYTYFNTSNPALDLSFHRHAVMPCHRNSSSNRTHVPCGFIFLLGTSFPSLQHQHNSHYKKKSLFVTSTTTTSKHRTRSPHPFLITFHDTRDTYPPVVHEIRLVTDLHLLY